ncbi:hypothetical protein KAR91_74170, partial [Candidatus Pacearchaeota archaeon]|nr:hypothetical protein [Candidatus Pacearchaeota archaeon]
GKDKDHIYLETKHKDTGKTHHVAIYKDGSVKDPNVLHGGKFDSKTLKEQRKEKNISVKKPVEKPVVEKEKPKREPKKVVVKKGLPKLKTRESKRITVKKHEKKQKLTANEKSYLNWYSGDGFKELNEYLRKDAPKKNPTLEKYADGLNSAINKDSLDKDTTLYRGINVKKITEAMQNVKSGNKIEISSFQSTTDNPGSASSYSGLAGIVLKINVSKGTNAVDMNKAGASRNPTEKEFLLPNKGHYIVKGIKKPKKGEVGRTIVVVDYIPEGVSEENILKKSVLLEAKEILEKEKSEDLKKSISKKIKRKRQKKNKKKR